MSWHGRSAASQTEKESVLCRKILSFFVALLCIALWLLGLIVMLWA